jgi:hypothetical protein
MTLDDYVDYMYYERERKEIAEIKRADRNARILNSPLLGPRTVERLGKVANPIFAEYGIAGGIYPALAAAYKMGVADAIK